MKGFSMTKSGIRTVTTKSRNFHSGVPPKNNHQRHLQHEYHQQATTKDLTAHALFDETAIFQYIYIKYESNSNKNWKKIILNIKIHSSLTYYKQLFLCYLLT